MASEPASTTYERLRSRAKQVLLSRGGVASEEQLIEALFGSIGNRRLWAPFLAQLLATDEDLVRRSDGSWALRHRPIPLEAGWPRSFVALDVETTGLRPSRHRVIEIGAVRYEQGRCVERFAVLVNPHRRLPGYIVRLTGIRDDDLVTAVPFAEVAAALRRFLGTSVVVGYNVGFDLDFLDFEFRRIGQGPLANPALDVLPLARQLLAGNGRYDLDSVCRAVGIERTTRHRALPDAEATAELYLRLVARAEEAGVRAPSDVPLQPARRPVVVEAVARGRAVLDRKLLENVPELPGVYLMRDGLGRVLYVGKARNLRQRLRSYFAQPLGYTRKMDGLLESVADLETVVVGSELEALLLESQFIQRHKPPYNTQLRNHEAYPYVKVELGRPWPRVLLARQREDDDALYVGPFRSTAAARAVVELLHLVLPLRTCHRSFRDARSYGRPCLQLTLGRCVGPCTGRVDPTEYRALVEVALRFLQGETGAVVERAQRLLAEAVERLDFERAARLRDLLRRSEELVLGHRLVQATIAGEPYLVVTPCPETGDRAFLLVVGGRLWARVAADAREPDEAVAARLRAAWERALAAPRWTLDQESLDAAVIVARWLREHHADPTVVALEEPIDWTALVRYGRELPAAALAVHGPIDSEEAR
ncbi:MAG: exonuclease domain-containing protein [Thermomicrobium sp.]|nr:exonuclease domain-containing protein [Thermomicrobium sp.]